MFKSLSSFRIKILVALATIIMICVATVGGLANYHARMGIENQTKAGVNALVKSLERETVNQIQISVKILETMAAMPIMTTKEYSLQREIFAKVIKENPHFKNIYIGFPDEPGLPSITPAITMPADYDARKRPWYQQAIQSDKIEVTDVYIDAASGLPVITVTKALRDATGKVLGTLAADIDLGSLSDTMAKIHLGKSGFGYIIDQKGVIIAHPNKELVREQTNLAGELSFIRSALAGEEGFTYYTVKGVEQVVSFKGINSLGWGVFVQQPKAEAFIEVAKINRNLLWTGIFTIILAQFIGLFFATSTARRIRSIANLADQVANGNLTTRSSIVAKDEFGRLSASFNKMIDNMWGIVREVVDSSRTINGASRELIENARQTLTATEEMSEAIAHTIKITEEGAKMQSNSMDIAQLTLKELTQAIGQIASGAQEQSVNVSNGAELVSQMVSGIEEASGRMQVVREAAMLNKTKADIGGQVVAETVQGMEEINRTVFAAANGIKQLGELSKQIGEIVQVIEGIAEQTNLLALNAAIEAARAGDHGKGFAVVADEVRKLAERAGKSTKEIDQLIQTTQKATEKAIKAMDKCIEEVKNGSAKTFAAGEALREIVEVASRSEEETNTINRAMQVIKEQSNAVVKAIDNIAAITEENSAATEEMAASSQNVLATMESISRVSADTSVAVQGVSKNTDHLRQIAQQVSGAAQELASLAQGLDYVVHKFKLE